MLRNSALRAGTLFAAYLVVAIWWHAAAVAGNASSGSQNPCAGYDKSAAGGTCPMAGSEKYGRCAADASGCCAGGAPKAGASACSGSEHTAVYGTAYEDPNLHSELSEKPFATTPCPECGKRGGLCEHCKAYATDFLSKLGGEMCPDCEYPEICDNCKAAVAGALVELPKLEATDVMGPGIPVAYIAGKFSDDRATLITSLVTEAGQQNLLGEDTSVACVYPDIMSKGMTMDTPVWACVSLAPGAQPVAPIQTFTIPAGEYMKVVHHGPYENLGFSWMAAFAFANMNGIEFGTGPCGEHYMNDPGSTPTAELLTDIYIPLAPAAPATPGISA